MGLKDLFRSKSKKKQKNDQETHNAPVTSGLHTAQSVATKDSYRSERGRKESPDQPSQNVLEESLGHDVTPDENYLPGAKGRKEKAKHRRDNRDYKDLAVTTEAREESLRLRPEDKRHHQLVTSSKKEDHLLVQDDEQRFATSSFLATPPAVTNDSGERVYKAEVYVVSGDVVKVEKLISEPPEVSMMHQNGGSNKQLPNSLFYGGDKDSNNVNRPSVDKTTSYIEKQEQDRLVEAMLSGVVINEATILGDGLQQLSKCEKSSLITTDQYHPTKPPSDQYYYSGQKVKVIRDENIVVKDTLGQPLYVTAEEMKDEDFYYKMDHPKRGVALIFNIGEFNPVTGMKKRNGYEVDGKLVVESFTRLGFDVQYHTNFTTMQIHKKINRVAEEFYGDVDCFVCVIMTHGNRSTSDLVFSKDGYLPLDFIIARFNGENCPTLVGKPKLFFIQACRGEKMDDGTDVPSGVVFDQTDASAKKRKIPIEADILISQATTPGYLSFRNSGRGSIYVRCFTHALEQYGGNEDILSVLTRVNAMVAFEFESNSSSQPEFSGKKQMPAFTSQLTKKLIFSPPPGSKYRL